MSAASAASQPATNASAALAVDAAHAVPADLTIEVIDRARDGRSFVYSVTSPWLDDLREKREFDWILGRTTGEIVNEYMSEFTAKGVELGSRLLSLEGAGVELWRDAAPPQFKNAYARLTAEGRTPQTIQVISEEPHIPWELMIPDVGDAGDGRPLGVRHAVARWFDDSPLRAAGAIANARVVAPTHRPPPKGLPKAQDEWQFVCERLGGERIDPATPVVLKTKLEAWGGTLLHFVCHGQDGTTQALLLDGVERLTSTQVAAMRGLKRAWAATPPIVFLNACDVGRAAPALSGAGGLVRAWVRAGAGAVIAPLWSVRDEIAHEVALHFYKRLLAESHTPYAEMLRDIRALAYDDAKGEDTYAAYCYFGSPRSSAA